MLILRVGGRSPYRRCMCTRGPHGCGDPTCFLKRNPLWSKYLGDNEVIGRSHDVKKSFRVRGSFDQFIIIVLGIDPCISTKPSHPPTLFWH